MACEVACVPPTQFSHDGPAGGERGFRVLVTRKIPEVALQRLRTVPGIQLDIYEHTSEAIPAEELRRRAQGVDGMLVLLTDKVTADLLEAAGRSLKVISTMSVGYNHVDTKALQDKGVLLGFTPDCLTETTADTTVALLLVTARRVGEAMAAVRDGSWGKIAASEERFLLRGYPSLCRL